MRLWLIAAIAVLAFSLEATAFAQLPFPKPGNSSNLARLPNDQVEGTIFEYKGTPKKKPKEGEEVKDLDGKFRLEGTAIFDVSARFSLPARDDVKKVAKKFLNGDKIELKLPEGAQQKRLGEYRKISGGKYRLDFNDKESINGIMIIWKKKDTNGVWLGTFSEKEGKRTVRQWTVELRGLED